MYGCSNTQEVATDPWQKVANINILENAQLSRYMIINTSSEFHKLSRRLSPVDQTVSSGPESTTMLHIAGTLITYVNI